ncbi:MAG: hypothetical protein GY869_00250, partial [Planctomycetes bacterium]|nr:hypothetical protein [Planctomycetota bacterium]
TVVAKHNERYARIFDRSKCENVVTNRADWTNEDGLTGECPLDLGEPYCYWGSTESRAMVDPAWIHGPERYTKRTRLTAVALLHYEPHGPAVEKLSTEAALEWVSEGKYRLPQGPGLSPYKTLPFFNPYLLADSADVEDLQRRNFHQLFRVAQAYKINVATIPAEALKSRVRELIS